MAADHADDADEKSVSVAADHADDADEKSVNQWPRITRTTRM
jgi:hypothetical protein